MTEEQILYKVGEIISKTAAVMSRQSEESRDRTRWPVYHLAKLAIGNLVGLNAVHELDSLKTAEHYDRAIREIEEALR